MFIAEYVSEKNFKIGDYLAKLQAKAWLSHALCAPGQHTDKGRRKYTRQSRSCLSLPTSYTSWYHGHKISPYRSSPQNFKLNAKNRSIRLLSNVILLR